jgi:hypothetical protein
MLEAFAPAIVRAAAASRKPLRRLVCFGNPFGMYPGGFFPNDAGPNFTLSPLLQPLERHRGRFTLFSNLDHGLKGGHGAVHAYLSGVKGGDANGLPERNITLDQRAADFVGSATRFPSIVAGVGGGCEMSWTRSGVMVPAVTNSRELFRRLFVEDSPTAKQQLARSQAMHGSILDLVNDQAKSLGSRLGARDNEKLDEYLTAVRDVERRLDMGKKWLAEPRPKVAMKEPADGEFVESLPVFYDLAALALQTDSTRVVALQAPHTIDTTALGLRQGYHALSHHGQVPENLANLMIVEKFMVSELARFLDKLHTTAEADGSGTMLDHTSVLFGSGMGNGNSHRNDNLPILIAGGGFKHRGHVVLPSEPRRRVPLCNLYLTMLQRFGVETERFNVSTGTLSEIA